jgi:hypothetical protein
MGYIFPKTKPGESMLRKIFLFLVVLTCFTAMHLSASIIKKPPTKSVETSFKELICTAEDRAVVAEIITTMAENSKLSLYFKKPHLKEIGAQINHLHPLKFLSAIFSEPELKLCMRFIWGDYFKRTSILDNLAPALTREAEKGKLEQYLKDFAKEVNISAESIKPFFDGQDWENMVLHLIYS